ncbi:MAG: FAD-binding oxidoreductase [Gemmatimonadaceae bacterium]|nr:FAD-binding oxidoreductase [Gemmatimonadaceae bacterium]
MSEIVAIPRSTADVVDAVRAAEADGAALRIVAGGSWLDAARPIDGGDRPVRRLDVRAVTGIVEYVPGDLTLTARAGTTLAEIEEATRPHGLWLPLDPYAAPGATLGATLATASWGTLAASNGLPRDLTIGVEFVDGRGMVVRGGGRVVKNVAGFDLVRLTIGAWGTLGVITEASVRLRARPTSECSLALDLPPRPEALAPFLRALRTAPLTPLAMELVDAPLARATGVGDADAIVVRLAGNAAALAAQRRVLAALGAVREVGNACWRALATALPADAWTVRLSQRPARLAALWHETTARALDLDGAWRQGSIERGVVRLVVPAREGAALALRLATLADRWQVIGERLPLEAWRALPVPASDRLSATIRRAFDPLQLLNPGVLGHPVAASAPAHPWSLHT